MTAIAISTPTERDRSALLAWLVEAEAANCIEVSAIVESPSLGAFPLMLVARAGAAIVGVAAWSSPFKLVLAANTHPEAIVPLVEAIYHRHPGIPGVIGPPRLAETFATAWTALAGGLMHVEMVQRILAVSHVAPPTGVAGTVRRTTAADHSTLVTWFQEFAREAEHYGPDEARQRGASMAREVGRSLEGFLWLDAEGTPVSIACAKAPTVHGIRIGPVYTPPEHRRRGYAAAVTAAASQHHLDEGREWVCLYTDASNPTSNRVYEGIGYQFVTDSISISFTPGQ